MAGIRMTPGFFFLLLTLADSEKHGYAMAKEVEERSDGAITLGPGSLYWSLGRLADVELIAECAAPSGNSGDERRRYYRLTDEGREVLGREVETLERVVSFARSKHVIGG